MKGYCKAVQQEDDMMSHGGADTKAPKFLASSLKAVIGAVYVDLDFNLQAMWLVCLRFLLLHYFFNCESQHMFPEPYNVVREMYSQND